jgi:asparagine synthase (glutamine-hydrolysing)
MKPLYWGRSDVGFGFASEPATLLTLLDLPAVAEGSSLADYLVLGVTDHRPATMFAGIQSLPPASWLRVPVRSTETPALTQYWRAAIGNIDDRPAERIARDLRDRFLDSVRLHLRSDVRVGTLLSGGIDSSAIVMSMRVAGGPQLDIRTFSYIPEEGTVSEERWIDEVNQAARAIPHKVRISRAQWESDARVLAERQGEPFGTLAVYAQSRLFGAAADQGVKVLLDGQGADEMLAGYGQFRGARIAAHLRRQEFARAVEVMLALRHDWSSRHAISAFVDALRVLLPAAAVRSALRLASTARKTAEPWLTRQRLAVEAHWRPEGARLLQERLRDAIEVSSLPALLRYVDRSSMMHGVESRLPFVTRELAEFALALPDHLLVSDSGLGKVIFRQAMRGIVPDSVLDRREKIGFAVPLGTWLLGSRYVADRLASAAALPCVNGRRVRALTDRLAARRPLGRAETFVAWRLLGLAEWSQQYGVAIT